MAKPPKSETPEQARAGGIRLRPLRGRVLAMGKLGLKRTFEAGEALEEAARLLRGNYSSWVRTECGREPRTALGYRKTFRVLGKLPEELGKLEVPPSVAIMVACAKQEARERALSAIMSERRLTVDDAKRTLAADAAKARPGRPAALEFFARRLRARSDAIAAEVARIADLAAVETPDKVQLMDAAVCARAMQPFLLRPRSGSRTSANRR